MQAEPQRQKAIAKEYLQSIDSHFSFGQNIMNFKMAMILSERSLTAKDDPSFPNLKSYYNALMEFYESFFFIMPKPRVDDFESKAKRFQAMYIEVLDGKLPISERTSLKMLSLLKNMRFILSSTMQTMFSYFYRMSQRTPKGLNNLDYLMEENIFQ